MWESMKERHGFSEEFVSCPYGRLYSNDGVSFFRPYRSTQLDSDHIAELDKCFPFPFDGTAKELAGCLAKAARKFVSQLRGLLDDPKDFIALSGL